MSHNSVLCITIVQDCQFIKGNHLDSHVMSFYGKYLFLVWRYRVF